MLMFYNCELPELFLGSFCKCNSQSLQHQFIRSMIALINSKTLERKSSEVEVGEECRSRSCYVPEESILNLMPVSGFFSDSNLLHLLHKAYILN